MFQIGTLESLSGGRKLRPAPISAFFSWRLISILISQVGALTLRDWIPNRARDDGKIAMIPPHPGPLPQRGEGEKSNGLGLSFGKNQSIQSILLILSDPGFFIWIRGWRGAVGRNETTSDGKAGVLFVPLPGRDWLLFLENGRNRVDHFYAPDHTGFVKLTHFRWLKA